MKMVVGLWLSIVALTGCASQRGAQVPVPLASKYAAVPHADVSDEFDAKHLNEERWAYRTKTGDDWLTGPEVVQFLEEEGTDYVSLIGKEEKGVGLSGKHEAHFGFYTMRWRMENIDPEIPTPWHPAVWMAYKNFASGEDERRIENTGWALEIDFMEFWYQPVWHIQTIAWKTGLKNQEGKLGRQVMRHEAADFPTVETGWLTQGLEYTPDYLQAWEIKEGTWQKVGAPIPFSEAETSGTNLYKELATPGYWILSNKWHFENTKKHWKFRDNPEGLKKFRMEDSALHIDHFRYFPLRMLH